ncbi:hypothetical protein BDN70DRAFT_900774 [Pholiota conissans]|uniref:Uncharacterized protein n=1 Tax=Pholiota conissans TaxID=109636 RepID=A0A9P6CMU4_9AGAR|nr:hypothetical protein BDN70DRAFT_900774 [Pholiota conissans]
MDLEAKYFERVETVIVNAEQHLIDTLKSHRPSEWLLHLHHRISTLQNEEDEALLRSVVSSFALPTRMASRDPTAVIYAGGRKSSSAQKLADVVTQYPGRIMLVKYAVGDKKGTKLWRRRFKLMRSTDVFAHLLRMPINVLGPIFLLLDIIESSTPEKDGEQFHNIDFGRHAW